METLSKENAKLKRANQDLCSKLATMQRSLDEVAATLSEIRAAQLKTDNQTAEES